MCLYSLVCVRACARGRCDAFLHFLSDALRVSIQGVGCQRRHFISKSPLSRGMRRQQLGSPRPRRRGKGKRREEKKNWSCWVAMAMRCGYHLLFSLSLPIFHSLLARWGGCSAAVTAVKDAGIPHREARAVQLEVKVTRSACVCVRACGMRQ